MFANEGSTIASQGSHTHSRGASFFVETKEMTQILCSENKINLND